MAEFPALPLFTDAFIGDTTHLTAAQTGAYLMLLFIAWKMPDCALPDDDTKLSRWARMDKHTWLRNKSTIMEFWKLGEDIKWRQGRLCDERFFCESKREKNSEAGKLSALKRLNRGSTNVPTKRQPNVNQTSTPTPTPTPISKEVPPTPNIVRMPFTQIPAEWKAWAILERSWSQEIIEDVWQQFRDYWTTGKGKNIKREEWTATFHNWCRKENIKAGYSQPKKSSAWNTPLD